MPLWIRVKNKTFPTKPRAVGYGLVGTGKPAGIEPRRLGTQTSDLWTPTEALKYVAIVELTPISLRISGLGSSLPRYKCWRICAHASNCWRRNQRRAPQREFHKSAKRYLESISFEDPPLCEVPTLPLPKDLDERQVLHDQDEKDGPEEGIDQDDRELLHYKSCTISPSKGEVSTNAQMGRSHSMPFATAAMTSPYTSDLVPSSYQALLTVSCDVRVCPRESLRL